MFGPNVTISTTGHPVHPYYRMRGAHFSLPVVIEAVSYTHLDVYKRQKEANGKGASYIDRNKDIEQRATVMLRDVHYVIEAHFEMTDRANASDNPGKFQDIITRRLRKGQAHSQPYFGMRQCTAHFGLWEGGEIPVSYTHLRLRQAP